MSFDPTRNGPWFGAGSPIQTKSVDGSAVTVLVDVPENPRAGIIPVLVPSVAGRPKEDMGALAEALVSTGVYAVIRPPLLNSGDEAPGMLDDLVMSPDEIIHWGRFLRSDECRLHLKGLKPELVISDKSACVAASLGATLSLHAQADEPVFDAMALFSFVPDYREFVPRKLNISYEELVARTWRYRLKDDPQRAAEVAALLRARASSMRESRERDLYQRIAEYLSELPKASRSDFALVLDGMPFNAFKGFSAALRDISDCQFGLMENIAKAQAVEIPLTFVIGGSDDYFDQETMDTFLVRSREEGRVRRAVRVEGADHRLRPLRCFERGIQQAIEWLSRDLEIEVPQSRFSLARAGLRRFHEVRGLALRHAPRMGLPPELMQKVLLPKADVADLVSEIFSRPEEVAEYARLLYRSGAERGDGKTILDELEPARLVRILSKALSERHYETVAAGLAMAPLEAASLFSQTFLEGLDPAQLDGILREFSQYEHALLPLLQGISPEAVEIIGRQMALRQLRRAHAEVPAYRSFVDLKVKDSPVKLEDYPITTKADYVEAYPLEERCLSGRFPRGGVLEESSGASGKPTHWIRCCSEDERMLGNAKFFFHHLFGSEDATLVLLSTFSQGAWASSTRLTVLGRYASVVKDIGTDVAKILDTIERLGPSHHYVIAAYPPFFRELLVEGLLRPGFSWKDYRIDVFHGGEGYTASWRGFAERTLREGAKIISSYGASDLEVAMAFETDIAYAVRRMLEGSPKLRVQLTGTPRMPVFVGQYNPADTYLEERRLACGETTIVATVNNPAAWQPRVRYDVGDLGRLVSYGAMKAFAQSNGARLEWDAALKLPFVILYGRVDGTISLDGANVYPEQVHEAVLRNAAVAPFVKSFQMRREEQEDASVLFRVILELFPGVEPPVAPVAAELENAVVGYLCQVNGDYRESLENNPTLKPVVEFRESGALGLEERIKHRYIG